MVKRCIAIEYSSELCRAVQLRHTNTGLVVERTATVFQEKYHFLATELQQAGFNLVLPAVMTTSIQNSHFVNISQDISSETPNDETDSNCPPVHLDKAIRIYLPGEHKLPGGNIAALTVSIDKSELDSILDLIAEQKIKCQRIDLAISALLPMIKKISHANGPQLTIFLLNNRLIIAAHENNNIIMVRNMPLKGLSSADSDTISNEVRLTWRASFGSQISAQDTINLIGVSDNGELIHDLKSKLGCELKTDNIYENTNFEEIPDNPGNFTLAISAGSVFFNPGIGMEINLLKVAGRHAAVDANNKDLYISIFLATLLIAILFINLMVKNSDLHDQHSSLIAHIDSIFADNLPALQDKAQNYDVKRKLAITQEHFNNEKQFTEDYARLVAPKPDITAIMSQLAKQLPGSTRFTSFKLENNKITLTANSEVKQNLTLFTENIRSASNLRVISEEGNDQNITLELEIVAGKND